MWGGLRIKFPAKLIIPSTLPNNSIPLFMNSYTESEFVASTEK